MTQPPPRLTHHTCYPRTLPFFQAASRLPLARLHDKITRQWYLERDVLRVGVVPEDPALLVHDAHAQENDHDGIVVLGKVKARDGVHGECILQFEGTLVVRGSADDVFLHTVHNVLVVQDDKQIVDVEGQEAYFVAILVT